MDSRQLHDVGRSLENVAAAIRERLRHEGQYSGGTTCLTDAIDLETLRLRGEGQVALADALHALRDA